MNNLLFIRLTIIISVLYQIIEASDILPPDTLAFRLRSKKNFNNNKCLVPNHGGRDVNRANCEDEWDQYWYTWDIETVGNTQYFKLTPRNDRGNQCIYDDNDQLAIDNGCDSTDNKYDWELDAIDSDNVYFRLKNRNNNLCISANFNGNNAKFENCNDNNDRFWEFRVEQYEVIDFQFDEAAQRVDEDANPETVAKLSII